MVESRTVFFTIITKNHVAYARVLADNLRKHHSALPLYVFFADKVDRSFIEECAAHFTPVEIEKIGDAQRLSEMSFYYSAKEFCCAIRPWAHDYLLANAGFDRCVFLDSDILVLGSFDNILSEFDRASFLLTPHFLTPAQTSEGSHFERVVLPTGVYNAGFLGLKKSPEVFRFIDWWKKKLLNGAFIDIEHGMYCDQVWLNYVPQFFLNVKILSSAAANVSWWNLHERKMEKTEAGEILVNGQPLLFFHFSGWDPEQPQKMSRHENIYGVWDNAAWIKISGLYREKLFLCGYEESRNIPHSFGFFQDGSPIASSMRLQYFDLLKAGAWAGGSPFDSSDFFKQTAAPPLARRITRVFRTALRGILNRLK